MDEQSIRAAAVTAIADLQLDCEVKEVRSPSGGAGWCVQFSGEYGQFCDEFKNQFGEESAPPIMREKIKGHLLKQIAKIRSKTGRARRPRAAAGGDRGRDKDVLAAPLKMLGDVLGGVSQIAGGALGQAANVAGLARDFTANVAEDVSPSADSDTRGVPRLEEGELARGAQATKAGPGASVRRGDRRATAAGHGGAERPPERPKKTKKATAKAAGKKGAAAKKSKKAVKSGRARSSKRGGAKR